MAGLQPTTTGTTVARVAAGTVNPQDGTGQNREVGQRDTVGKAEQPDPALQKPQVAAAGTAQVDTPAPATDAQEAKALFSSAGKATVAHKDAWMAANSIATANLKEFKAYNLGGSLTIPKPEVATQQFETLVNHFSSEDMAATLPVTWQLHSAPEFKTAQGAEARALVAEYGFDAISREYVAALKTDPANADSAALASAIVKNGDRPVPAELLAGVPESVKSSLGAKGLTFKNVCPELFVAAKKLQLSTVDPKDFASAAQTNAIQAMVEKPELQMVYANAARASKAGLQQATLMGQGKQPEIIDSQQAGGNFLTLMDFLSRNQDMQRRGQDGQPVLVPGTTAMPPVTSAGALAQKALLSGDNSGLEKVDRLGYDADVRVAVQSWKNTARDYMTNGIPVDATKPELGRKQLPQGMDAPVAFAYAVVDDPKSADLCPEAYGSAAQFLASLAVASNNSQAAENEAHGFNVAK